MISSRTILLVVAMAASAVPGWAADPEVASLRERVSSREASFALDVRATYPSAPCDGDLLDFRVSLQNVSQIEPGPFAASIENPIPGGTSYVPGSATGGAVFDEAGHRVSWEGSLDVGESKAIDFSLRVDDGLPPGILVIDRTVGTIDGRSLGGDLAIRVCRHDSNRPQAPPEFGSWLSAPELPGFEAKVAFFPAGQMGRLGQAEPDCIAETLCVSGALEGRPELFVKVVGPRPNGFLWVQLSRFTPSRVVIWLRQVSTGLVRHYVLDAAGPADSPSGLQDRQAFLP